MATQWDMNDVIFTLILCDFLRLDLQMSKFATVLRTFTKIEAANGK